LSSCNISINMIQIIPSSGDNTLVVSATETVSSDDYEKILVPAIEEKLKTNKKIRFLYHLGSDFSGYTARAVWDDAKLGVKYSGIFEKIAVVTEVPWVIDAVALCRLFVSCPVKIFDNGKMSEARDWFVQ
jgi:hypothetical protein